MFRQISIILISIFFTGCATVPSGLENNFHQLKVKMQSGDIVNISETGWYKSRKFVMQSRGYSMAMNATSEGGYVAITTPRYCQGIMGVIGSPLAIAENDLKVNARIDNMIKQTNVLIRNWIEAYSSELKGVCDAYKLFESKVTIRNGTYDHYLISYDDNALLDERFNVFVLMEQNGEKLLGVLNLGPLFVALYTLRGETICETTKEPAEIRDTSVEGLIKMIQEPTENKLIPGFCFGKKIIFDLNGLEVTGLIPQPKGAFTVRFEDGINTKVRLVQFTDNPEVIATKK